MLVPVLAYYSFPLLLHYAPPLYELMEQLAPVVSDINNRTDHEPEGREDCGFQRSGPRKSPAARFLKYTSRGIRLHKMLMLRFFTTFSPLLPQLSHLRLRYHKESGITTLHFISQKQAMT